MKLERSEITPQLLSEVLRLDPSTGHLFWLPRPLSSFRRERDARHFAENVEGRRAFTSLRTTGAHFGNVYGVGFSAAQVVWALHYGEWPDGMVLHRNGDVSDDRPDNLFLKGEEAARRALRSDSGSRIPGVTMAGSKWRARLSIGGRLRTLGTFETVAEAQRAVEAARAEQARQKPPKRPSKRNP